MVHFEKAICVLYPHGVRRAVVMKSSMLGAVVLKRGAFSRRRKLEEGQVAVVLGRALDAHSMTKKTSATGKDLTSTCGTTKLMFLLPQDSRSDLRPMSPGPTSSWCGRRCHGTRCPSLGLQLQSRHRHQLMTECTPQSLGSVHDD